MTKENALQIDEQADGSPEGSCSEFAASEAALVLRNVAAARAILRTVVLAADAQRDGSVEYDDDNSPTRWYAAMDEACARLATVRDVLMKSAAPRLDWFTSLALAEAIAAALWHGYSCSRDERLSASELVCVAQVAIEALESLTQECETESLFQVAGLSNESILH